jgi:hypothetical protein
MGNPEVIPGQKSSSVSFCSINVTLLTRYLSLRLALIAAE